MPAKVISFYNHKGGVTKTTTTILTATNILYYFKKKVAIIDSDDNQWSIFEEKAEELNFLQSNYSEQEIGDMLKEKKIIDYPIYKGYINNSAKSDENEKTETLIDLLINEFDYIFIDMGNRSIDQSEKIFKKIDYFIIPFSQDKQEIKKAVQFYNFVNAEFPNIKKYLLLVKLVLSESNKRIFNEIKEQFKTNNWEYFDTAILDRKKYKEKYRSFFFSLKNKDKEEKELSYIDFIKEFIKKTS